MTDVGLSAAGEGAVGHHSNSGALERRKLANGISIGRSHGSRTTRRFELPSIVSWDGKSLRGKGRQELHRRFTTTLRVAERLVRIEQRAECRVVCESDCARRPPKSR